jgi:hypothetical protein
VNTSGSCEWRHRYDSSRSFISTCEKFILSFIIVILPLSRSVLKLRLMSKW